MKAKVQSKKKRQLFQHRNKTTNFKKEIKIKEQLNKLTKAVRHKYIQLQKDAEFAERAFNLQAKPFVAPLQKLVSEGFANISVKDELQPVKKEKPEEQLTQEQLQEQDEEKKKIEHTSRTVREEKLNTSVENRPESVSSIVKRNLLRLSNAGAKSIMDTTYGVRLDGHGGTLIGNKKIVFTSTMVNIEDRHFTSTPGLLELLFKQIPNTTKLNVGDLDAYKKILQLTSAHHQMYSPEKPINANKSVKYVNVIATLFPAKSKRPAAEPAVSPAVGSGIKRTLKTAAATNPNSLVKRLKLLKMSQAAGHSGHHREIGEIIDLLKRYKIIE